MLCTSSKLRPANSSLPPARGCEFLYLRPLPHRFHTGLNSGIGIHTLTKCQQSRERTVHSVINRQICNRWISVHASTEEQWPFFAELFLPFQSTFESRQHWCDFSWE